MAKVTTTFNIGKVWHQYWTNVCVLLGCRKMSPSRSAFQGHSRSSELTRIDLQGRPYFTITRLHDYDLPVNVAYRPCCTEFFWTHVNLTPRWKSSRWNLVIRSWLKKLFQAQKKVWSWGVSIQWLTPSNGCLRHAVKTATVNADLLARQIGRQNFWQIFVGPISIFVEPKNRSARNGAHKLKTPLSAHCNSIRLRP